MKRTIVFLSLILAFTAVAFGQTTQLKSAKAVVCGSCCPNGCGTCCPDGCGSCCRGK